jgi:phospholipase/carboxylesterase
MYNHSKNIITAGTPVSEAKKAIIMLHGRGATAQDIISLQKHLKLGGMAIFAPQATNYSWYPNSFMAPVESNQPALDSALTLIGGIVEDIKGAGITADHIYFMGFSQGACLTLEYIARNAQRYGGAIAFTGGLVGQVLNLANYQGDFNQTPVLIATGNPDPHVPLSRVEESQHVLENMNANVVVKVYHGRPHTIQMEEIALANELVFN